MLQDLGYKVTTRTADLPLVVRGVRGGEETYLPMYLTGVLRGA